MHNTFSWWAKEASPRTFSGVILESRVDWISDHEHLADSLKMMQLCRHRRKACFSRAHSFQPHSLFLLLTGYVLWDTTVDSQYASTRDIRLIASGNRSHWGTPWPKRTVAAWAWRDRANNDVGERYEAGSNPAHWRELACIATSASYSIRDDGSGSTLA